MLVMRLHDCHRNCYYGKSLIHCPATGRSGGFLPPSKALVARAMTALHVFMSGVIAQNLTTMPQDMLVLCTPFTHLCHFVVRVASSAIFVEACRSPSAPAGMAGAEGQEWRAGIRTGTLTLL